MKLNPSVCMLCIIMPSSHADIMCPLCELLCIGRMIADGCGGVSGRSCDPPVSFHLLEGAGEAPPHKVLTLSNKKLWLMFIHALMNDTQKWGYGLDEGVY